MLFNKNKNKKENFRVNQKFFAILTSLLALILFLSFFGKGGPAGKLIFSFFNFLIGQSIFLIPPILILISFLLFLTKEKFPKSFAIGICLFLIAVSALISSLNRIKIEGNFQYLKILAIEGGWLGAIISFSFLKLFGPLFSYILFCIGIFFGILILVFPFSKILKEKGISKIETERPKIFKFFAPKFKVEKVEIKEKKFIPKPAEVKEVPIQKLKTLEYTPPPFELLANEEGLPSAGDVKENSTIIKRTLENFGINVEMSGVNIGPTVTQYTLKPGEGVKLSKITSLSNNLALALAAHPIRIEAPIPGRPLVGIEVPNKSRLLVRLRKLISNPVFLNSPSSLTFVLGRDVSGDPIYADLSRMPHLLVAGATGTGKTIFLNSLILSLLYRNSPQSLNFILIDPKRVEFPIYNELPHALNHVIYEPQKAVNLLKWLISEMERRFEILAETNLRDIVSYNEIALKEEKNLMPYLILVIDELADLMAAKGKEIEAGIVRLAQLSRAVGIHLVLATQRPSVEVITGLIKANITSRISFQVASQVDSRTVLDMAGAERLLGLGDMLFLSADDPKPKRIQGAFVSEKEVKKVVNYLKFKIKPVEKISEDEFLDQTETELLIPEESEIFEDPLYEEAKKVIIQARKASASLLQRRLRIGYARAARLLDVLEEKGIVGPLDGSKPREVYPVEQLRRPDDENYL